MTFDFEGVQSLMDDDRPITASLSSGSAALALVAVWLMQQRWRWQGITDGQWNLMEAQVALLELELMTESQLGHIVATIAEPKENELLCDGSQYERVDYPALYEILESEYIDDADYFSVPDLRNVFPVGSGDTYDRNETGGEDAHELSESEIPSHRHSYWDYTSNIDVEGAGVPDPFAVGLPKISTSYTGYTGGGNSHENRPPFLGVQFVIVAR